MSNSYSDTLLEADIQRTHLQERLKEASYDYHNNLLRLLDDKKHSAKKDMRLWDDTIAGFQTCVALNNHIIEKSFDIAKTQLQEAFEKSGLYVKAVEEDGQ